MRRTQNLKHFQITPGHYQVMHWQIWRGGPNHWQVRDQFEDLLETFRTLKEAFNYAWNNQASIHKTK